MKTLLKVSFSIVIFSIFYSCKDDICNNINQETNSKVEKNQFDILSFNSKEDLLQAIQEGMNGEIPKTLTRSSDFISLLSPCKNSTKATEEETAENYYEVLGYDTLVPNPAFARLINPDGELMVKDSIYKITPNGTYYFSLDKKQLFTELYSTDSTLCGVQISDNLYKISDGIYRFNTFKTDKEYVDETKDNSDSDGVGTTTKTGIPEPDFDSFPIFNADHHTWVGKIIQNIFGSTKAFDIKFDSNRKRRVKGSFYFYNYGVYAEIGAQGWTDKKNWIGWSKTTSDELRVGWRGVLLETKIPDTYANSIKNLNNKISVSPNQYMDLPGTSHKINTSTMIIPDFDATAFEKAAGIGVKEGLKYLKSWLGSEPSEWQKAEAVLIATRTHIYTYIVNEDQIRYNTKSYTHVFAKQVKFMISINFYNLPGFSNTNDALKWANAIKGTTEMVYPTLKTGEVYSCARFGNEWKGMKIVKE